MYVKIGLKHKNSLGKIIIKEKRLYNARKVSTTYGFTEIEYVDEVKGLTHEIIGNNELQYIISCTDTVGMRNLKIGEKNEKL